MFFDSFQEVKKLLTTFYGFDIWVWSWGLGTGGELFLKLPPKRAPTLEKTWSFVWKTKNRPTYGDFGRKKSWPQTSPNF